MNFNINIDSLINLLKNPPPHIVVGFFLLGVLLILGILNFENEYIKLIILFFSLPFIGHIIIIVSKELKKIISFVQNIISFNGKLKNIDILAKGQKEILNTLYTNDGKYKFQSYQNEIKSLVANDFIKPIQDIQEFEKLYQINKRLYKVLDKQHNNKIINHLKTLTDNEKKVLELFYKDDYDWIDNDMQNAINTLHRKGLINYEYNKSINLNKNTLNNINIINNEPIKKKIVKIVSYKMAVDIKPGTGIIGGR
ncbi:MAG: hypothetical protein WA945_11610 [Arcobacteraceae bacterium]